MTKWLYMLYMYCLIFLVLSLSSIEGSAEHAYPPMNEEDVRHTLIDHSPYCAELAEITDLCNEVFINVLCPKTCKYEDKTRKKLCGIPTPLNKKYTEERHHREKRIIGGEESIKGEFPWQVGLYFNGGLKCGGAVLTPNWIVTAAHCFDKNTMDEKEWLVTAGDHSLLVNDVNTEQVRNVKKIIIHEKNHRYRKDGYKDYPDDYDIALLKLESPLRMNNYTKPICLPGLQDYFEWKSLCKISGWGSTNGPQDPVNILRKATVKLVPRDICNLPISYDGKILERSICAGYKSGHTDACTYDSGGALACKKGDNWFAVGLVSWGYQCGRPYRYGIYTNVRIMKSWILEILLTYDDATNTVTSIFEKISTLKPAPGSGQGIHEHVE